jgi:hypothetical protein
MSDHRELEQVDQRPDNEVSPSGLTGVCANGEHERCLGRVYVGHVLAGNQRGAKFDPCRCDCHDEPGEDGPVKLREAA